MNSFYKGMHWVKYALVILTFRSYIAAFDIEGYYTYDYGVYKHRQKDIHSSNTMNFMLLALIYFSIPKVFIYGTLGVVATNYQTLKANASEILNPFKFLVQFSIIITFVMWMSLLAEMNNQVYSEASKKKSSQSEFETIFNQFDEGIFII